MGGDRPRLVVHVVPIVPKSLTKVNIFEPDRVESFIESAHLLPNFTAKHQKRAGGLFHFTGLACRGGFCDSEGSVEALQGKRARLPTQRMAAARVTIREADIFFSPFEVNARKESISIFCSIQVIITLFRSFA